jgi:hypothetical protein
MPDIRGLLAIFCATSDSKFGLLVTLRRRFSTWLSADVPHTFRRRAITSFVRYHA